MVNIFISYRREDTGFAANWVYERLQGRQGIEATFIDVQNIPPATSYEKVIMDYIENVDLVLAFIGERWEAQGRINDVEDLVRRELARAFELKAPVLPVLTDRMHMPPANNMPAELRIIKELNAVFLRQAPDFDNDFERLYQAILGYEKRHRAPAAQVDGRITGEHLALIYSCWRAPQHDSRFPGHDVYRFDVMVEATRGVIDQIKKVTYLLPPAWPTSPITVLEKDNCFGLQELTWADLLARARIEFENQEEPVYLSCFIRLSQYGPRLIKKQQSKLNPPA
jgi:hypothetical protein